MSVLVLDSVAQIEAIAAEQLAHQALIAEVDSALQTYFTRGVMLHETDGKPVEQIRRAFQFVSREPTKDLRQFSFSPVLVSSQQTLARFSKRKTNLAAVRLPFRAA